MKRRKIRKQNNKGKWRKEISRRPSSKSDGDDDGISRFYLMEMIQWAHSADK
jgi:hypothetical protein